MKRKFAACVLVLTAGAVLAESDLTDRVGPLVREIVTRAKKGDTAYFAPLMDQACKGQETNLVAMIQRSGMSTNYATRCRLETNGTGRLDYHYLEQGCHFQIDLAKTNNTWTIKRIWFCR